MGAAEQDATSLLTRLEALTTKPSAFVVLPGSMGTFTEMCLAANLNYIAPASDTPTRPILAWADPWEKVWATLAVAGVSF